MDLVLPGRNPEEPDDYEAQCALRTLLEAESIQYSGNEDLLSRIQKEIEKSKTCLGRVEALVADVLSGEESGEGEGEAGGLFYDANVGRTDTRTVQDFLDRFNQSRRKEHMSNLVPLKKKGRY